MRFDQLDRLDRGPGRAARAQRGPLHLLARRPGRGGDVCVGA